jgi:hypothetical protein
MKTPANAVERVQAILSMVERLPEEQQSKLYEGLRKNELLEMSAKLDSESSEIPLSMEEIVAECKSARHKRYDD